MKHKNLAHRHEWNFTKEELDILIGTLAFLVYRVKKGVLVNSNVGICANWDKLLPFSIKERLVNNKTRLVAYTLVSLFAASWPKTIYPGKELIFPIPYDGESRLWEGPNLKNRIELMQYILKRLKDWRRRTPA